MRESLRSLCVPSQSPVACCQATSPSHWKLPAMAGFLVATLSYLCGGNYWGDDLDADNWCYQQRCYGFSAAVD